MPPAKAGVEAINPIALAITNTAQFARVTNFNMRR